MISGRILLSKLWDFGGLCFCLFPPLLPPPTIYFHNKIIHTHTHIYNTFTEHQPPTHSNLLSFFPNQHLLLLIISSFWDHECCCCRIKVPCSGCRWQPYWQETNWEASQDFILSRYVCSLIFNVHHGKDLFLSFRYWFFFFFFFFGDSVTTVESGSKALEFLGLNDEQSNNNSTASVSPNNVIIIWIISFLFRNFNS